MDKFLYFTDGDTIDAAADMACSPLSSFLCFTVDASDAVSIGMQFVFVVIGTVSTQ